MSPQKLYGVPVGLMFFEGAPRLARSGVTIPALQVGDPDRVVVEAYPGVLARRLVGRRSYKQETSLYGFTIEAPIALCDDPLGDHLDALLCAMQAAWAWRNRAHGFGVPSDLDPLEGWIADPSLGP